MKLKYSLLAGCILISAVISAPKAFAQQRQPDGSVIYKDGSRRLPNGTVVYPNGTTKPRSIKDIFNPNRNNPVNTKRYPGRDNTGQGLPPGQAKKRYGGEAKDYAHGHNKGNKHWNKNEDRDDDNDQGDHKHDRSHNNGKGHGKEKDD